MNKEITWSIVIANHKSWRDQLLRNTIESLVSELSGKLEVIVVNNGMSQEGAKKTKKWLESKEMKSLFLEDGNSSKARNVGAKEAKGKYLLFLDNDVEVGKGAIGKVETYLRKHPRVGGGQLKLLRTNKRKKYDSAGEKFTASGFLVERAREAEDRGQFDSDEPIFSGKGAAMVVRRELFEKVGRFDEDYQYYWEEPDLCWRIWKAGYEVRFLWMGMVYHAFMSEAKPVSRERRVGVAFLGCRNQVMTVLKNGVGWGLVQMIVSITLAWIGLAIWFIVQEGDFERSKEVVKAFWWIVKHRKAIEKKRKWVQEKLKSDEKWMGKVVVKRDWRWYTGKGWAYVTGRGF